MWRHLRKRFIACSIKFMSHPGAFVLEGIPRSPSGNDNDLKVKALLSVNF